VLLADVIAASAAVAATRSRTAKAGTIAELLRRAGADEVEPVTAWLAGELRQGALEGVVLDAVATAAGVPAAAVRRAFMLSGRLPETAAIALTGGVDALDAVCLEVGRPVRPMLASPGSSLDAALADLGTDVSVEFKLDGARIQVHRDGKIVRCVDPRPARGDRRRPGARRPGPGPAVRHRPRRGDSGPGRRRPATRVPGHVRLDALADLLAAEVLDDALAAGHEGVVVKALGAAYAAGRRGKAWQKVNLGARDPDSGEAVMVSRTFKGMTDELLDWQTQTFPEHAREHTGWGVHLRPELVVEIVLDGAQRSLRYPGGVALRFACVVRYRPDKSPAEADTIESVRTLLTGP
jgi:DNA ligase-1